MFSLDVYIFDLNRRYKFKNINKYRYLATLLEYTILLCIHKQYNRGEDLDNWRRVLLW